MAAFLEAPFLRDSSRMRVDHITTLLAILLGDPLRSTALRLICKSFTPEDSSYIWSQWKPHFTLPSSHPLAEGTLARDRILSMMQMAYTTPESEAKDTQALSDLVAVAIPVETFILFTAATL
jgi:hypothetical protein